MTKALDDIHGPANVGQNFDPAAIPDRVFAHNRIPKRHPVPPERPRFCMTHFKPRFGGAFFALRKARSTVARGGHNPSRFQEPEVLLLVGGVAELRATRWCAERSQRKAPRRGAGLRWME